MNIVEIPLSDLDNVWNLVKKDIAHYDLNLKKQMEIQTARIEAMQRAQEEVMREQLFKKEKSIFNFKKSDKKLA